MKKFLMLFAVLAMASNALAKQKLDSQTGLILAQGYKTVKANCIACHGASLITQNHATKDGWLATIRWMQTTQNLRKFTFSEENVILDYLAKNYAPIKSGRRMPLQISDWYNLGED
ncbi:MAG: hypothetical protein V3V31_07740 [Methylococcales bacterium]